MFFIEAYAFYLMGHRCCFLNGIEWILASFVFFTVLEMFYSLCILGFLGIVYLLDFLRECIFVNIYI